MSEQSVKADQISQREKAGFNGKLPWIPNNKHTAPQYDEIAAPVPNISLKSRWQVCMVGKECVRILHTE